MRLGINRWHGSSCRCREINSPARQTSNKGTVLSVRAIAARDLPQYSQHWRQLIDLSERGPTVNYNHGSIVEEAGIIRLAKQYSGAFKQEANYETNGKSFWLPGAGPVGVNRLPRIRSY